ncbi:hypothetical protein IU11_11980 [Cellulosimicrobium sp. MM]|nr:hypothetical protein IU11_11980 [Cellulosimicrobium sp. MM]
MRPTMTTLWSARPGLGEHVERLELLDVGLQVVVATGSAPPAIAARICWPAACVMPTVGTQASFSAPRVGLSAPSVLLYRITAAAPACAAYSALSANGHEPRLISATAPLTATPSHVSGVQPWTSASAGCTIGPVTPSSGVSGANSAG